MKPLRASILMAVAVLASACLGSIRGTTRTGAGVREPRFPEVAVARFAIVAQPAGREQVRPDGNGLSWILAESATAEAEAVLLESRIAAAVHRASAAGGERQPRLSGEIVMPVSLPPHLKGLAAAGSDGNLATASVRLVDAKGRTLGEGTASVHWNDVRWLTGAKHRRPRSANQALADAARKAANLAVLQMKARMGERKNVRAER